MLTISSVLIFFWLRDNDKTSKVIVDIEEITQIEEVDEDAFDKDNKEMVEEMIVLAINEAQEKIDEESEAINEKITGRPGGLGF